MKIRCFVLTLAVIAIAVAKVSAKEPPVGDNPQPVCPKTHVEVEATSSVITSIDIEENIESKEQEVQFFESTCSDDDSTNLYIKNNSTIDTTTFNGLKKYFKSIQPVLRKLDLQDIEKIEIL